MDGHLKLLNPKRIRVKSLCCSYCDLSYNREHYKALFEAKKLIYFKSLDTNIFREKEIICHDCLVNLADKESLSFKVETDTHILKLDIDPTIGNKGDTDDFLDDLI
tara:strand:- start:457 stop:774 length:318 start_codon:yes stop_codon:yes gene_type:complete